LAASNPRTDLPGKVLWALAIFLPVAPFPVANRRAALRARVSLSRARTHSIENKDLQVPEMRGRQVGGKGLPLDGKAWPHLTGC
jgi:hypothetical protein